MFNFTLFIFLITILFLVFASIYDYKYRIIPNYLILILFCIGILTGITQSIISSSFSYILNTLLSIGITIILCYILWELGLFAGGDFKLFVAISVLNPFNLNIIGNLLNFQVINIPIFSITLLIASIVSVVPFLLLISLYQMVSQRYYLILFNIFKSKQTILSFINSIILLFLISSFLNIFSLNTPYFILLLLSILLIIIFSKIQSYNINSFYFAISFVYVLLILSPIFSNSITFSIFQLHDLITIIIFLILIYFAISVYKIIKEKILSETKKVSNIKEGDVPYYNYYLVNKKVKVTNTSLLKAISNMLSGKYYKNLKIDSRKAGGFTNKDIRFLNGSYKDNLIGNTIKLKKTIPFAPAVLLGYILLNIIGDLIWIII